MFDNNEKESPLQAMPTISGETRNKILESFGLLDSPQTQQILAGITGEIKSPNEAIVDITKKVFSDVISANRELAIVLDRVLKEAYSTVGGNSITMIWHRDYVSQGMAIVLEAYNIETGFDIIPNLEKLSPEEVAKAGQTLREILPNKSDRNNKSILEILLNRSSIPDQNVNLNEIVKKIRRAVPLMGMEDDFDMGAVAMYKILQANWYKLNSPKPSSPPTFLPPEE